MDPTSMNIVHNHHRNGNYNDEEDSIFYKEHGNTQEDDWIPHNHHHNDDVKDTEVVPISCYATLSRKKRQTNSNQPQIILEWNEDEEDDDETNAFASLQRDLYPQSSSSSSSSSTKKVTTTTSSKIITHDISTKKRLPLLDDDDDSGPDYYFDNDNHLHKHDSISQQQQERKTPEGGNDNIIKSSESSASQQVSSSNETQHHHHHHHEPNRQERTVQSSPNKFVSINETCLDDDKRKEKKNDELINDNNNLPNKKNNNKRMHRSSIQYPEKMTTKNKNRKQTCRIMSPQDSMVVYKARSMASKQQQRKSITNTPTSFLSSSQIISKSQFQQSHYHNNHKKIMISSTSSSIVGSRPAHWDTNVTSRNNKRFLQSTTMAKQLSKVTKSKTNYTRIMTKQQQQQQLHKTTLLSSSWQPKINTSNLNFGPAFLSSSSKHDKLIHIDDDDDDDDNQYWNKNTPVSFHSPSKTNTNIASTSQFNNSYFDSYSTPPQQQYSSPNDLHSNGYGPSTTPAATTTTTTTTTARSNNPFYSDTTLSPTNLWPQQQPQQLQRNKTQKLPAGRLVQRWKQYHSSLERHNVRLQSNSYPFTATPNRNDPRSSFQSYIDITIVSHLKKYNNNNHPTQQPCNGALAYIHQYQPINITSKNHQTVITTTTATLPITSTVVWVVFSKDTIRKQNIIPNTQLRIYDSIITPIKSDQHDDLKWMVLCTKLCEPYPSTILSPLPNINIL